jgi:heme oxygenase
MGLAQRLRDGTWALHTETERAGVMPALLRGTLPAAGFHWMQRNLYAVYAALETGLRQHAAHPLLAPLDTLPLARCSALAADLQALCGDGWAHSLPVLPVAAAYAERLRALAATQPALLAAHAYVRYLGDLSGGQALRRIVRQRGGMVGEAGEAGTLFFDFGPPAQVAALARGLRSALDTLPVDETQTEALVAEARWAFAQHVALFEELASTP